MKRGFFGGTFNPPHLGHIRAAEAAAEQLGLDRLMWIPAGIPPHKKLPEGSASPEQRMEMVKLAAGPDPGRTEVSDIELRREGPSYTVMTAKELLSEDPEGELWLLCGTDMFRTLYDWYEGEWLLRNLCVAVYPRAAGQLEELQDIAERYRLAYGTKTEIIRLEPLEISSTKLRELLPQRQGAGYLSGELYAYILEHRLYGIRPDLSVLRETVRPYYKPSRLPHVVGCTETAGKLAMRWGVDAGLAQEAAILHDITKKMSAEEQLHLCEKYDIIPGIGRKENLNSELLLKIERGEGPEGLITGENAEKYFGVLHEFSGAALARGRFGASDEVTDAIMWHTTGRKGMSVLEKIIWLADYTEPTRTLDGIDEIRRLSFIDLDRALELSMSRSLGYVERQHGSVHPATEEALRDLQNRGIRNGKK